MLKQQSVNEIAIDVWPVFRLTAMPALPEPTAASDDDTGKNIVNQR